MSTELSIVDNELLMWEDQSQLTEIKKIFAPTLNDNEFKSFIGLGKATGCNPFLKEIWAVKFGNSAAQIFIGRDGYRKGALRHSQYDYHRVDAVYENDVFSCVDGKITHKYTLKNRGALMGAYCVVKRKDSTETHFQFCPLEEYSTGKSLWSAPERGGKPATMIKKVAESQTLRMAFQDKLGGSYAEEERDSIQPIENQTDKPKHQSMMDRIHEAKGITIDSDIEDAEVESGLVANDETLQEIHRLLSVKDFPIERLQAALQHYNAETLAQLTQSQANNFIGQLNKVEDK